MMCVHVSGRYNLSMALKLFSDVHVLIWDFDGTLYKQVPALWDMIRASEIRVIIDQTGWTQEKAKEEFYKIYKVTTPSGTKTVSELTQLSNKDASLACAKYTDYSAYLHPDPKLQTVFKSLSRYTHYLLVNGTQIGVAKGLRLLGISKSIFSEIVTSEVVGESKPSERGYLHIMKQTGLPASSHLMIGDREAVDLAPAKALGMHTCLVWSETRGTVAEVTLPSVYDVVSMLG